MTASLAALVVLATALDRLGVAYAIGGSVASSFHGEMRTTHDIDVLVELVPEKVSALVAALAPEFYVDETSVREALLRKRAFNVIHRSAAAEIDVFCSSGGSLDSRAPPARPS
jgi:predicted nucleotidyltransferase